MKISICIPTYEMHGQGVNFLKKNFEVLSNQTYKNFEVIVSDNSKDKLIENLCNEFKEKLEIVYLKNNFKIGNSSANINNAIKNARGDLIKIIFQDDFLYSDKSLEEIAENFDLKNDKWLITACEHTSDGINFIKPFYPKYNNFIQFGYNTISSPSVLTILNNKPLLFDEELMWLMDCDYYKRCYDSFGKPKILNKINVVNRIGAHQVTSTMVNRGLKNKEFFYIFRKYLLRKFID